MLPRATQPMFLSDAGKGRNPINRHLLAHLWKERKKLCCLCWSPLPLEIGLDYQATAFSSSPLPGKSIGFSPNEPPVSKVARVWRNSASIAQWEGPSNLFTICTMVSQPWEYFPQETKVSVIFLHPQDIILKQYRYARQILCFTTVLNMTAFSFIKIPTS